MTEHTPIETQKLERYIRTRVNVARRDRGIHELEEDPTLTAMARDHSRYLASISSHSDDIHTGFDEHGYTVTQRAECVGYNCSRYLPNGLLLYGVAENISYVWDKDPDTREIVPIYTEMGNLAEVTVSGWLDSPPHRDNTVNPFFFKQGVGVAVGEDHVLYIVQYLF